MTGTRKYTINDASEEHRDALMEMGGTYCFTCHQLMTDCSSGISRCKNPKCLSRNGLRRYCKICCVLYSESAKMHFKNKHTDSTSSNLFVSNSLPLVQQEQSVLNDVLTTDNNIDFFMPLASQPQQIQSTESIYNTVYSMMNRLVMVEFNEQYIPHKERLYKDPVVRSYFESGEALTDQQWNTFLQTTIYPIRLRRDTLKGRWWMIKLRNVETVIGALGFSFTMVDENTYNVSLAIMLSPEWWGRNVAAEALFAMIHHYNNVHEETRGKLLNVSFTVATENRRCMGLVKQLELNHASQINVEGGGQTGQEYRFIRNVYSVPLDEKLIGKIWNGFALARNVCNGIGAAVQRTEQNDQVRGKRTRNAEDTSDPEAKRQRLHSPTLESEVLLALESPSSILTPDSDWLSDILCSK